jgi:hypothetical protein
MSRSYISPLPLVAYMAVAGQLLLYFPFLYTLSCFYRLIYLFIHNLSANINVHKLKFLSRIRKGLKKRCERRLQRREQY